MRGDAATAAAPPPFEATPEGATWAELLAVRRRNLGRLLHYAWERSPFYRSYFADHGLRERDLDEVEPGDLPPTSKELLMEHFDSAVTDPRLRLAEVQAWIGREPLGARLYGEAFVALHTSGSSGRMGTFVYDRAAWRLILERMRLPRFDEGAAARVAYYGAVHSRFAGATLCSCALAPSYALALLSVLEPRTQIVTRLNELRPKMLVGYASALAVLAELALAGELAIRPKIVVSSGDPLSASVRARIAAAWGVQPVDLYSASESLLIAISPPDAAEMCLLDDLQVTEILDEHGREVRPGASGRLTLTNLYNRALPLIRYTMDDVVTKGREAAAQGPATIAAVRGRDHELLPIRCADGRVDDLNPIVLTGCGGFDMPGLAQLQFVSHTPECVEILYAGAPGLEEALADAFRALLAGKGAAGSVAFTVRRVARLAGDPATGKLPLVRTAAAG